MSACTGKRWYSNYKRAQRGARAWNSPGLRPYLCAECDGWHIGHAQRKEELVPGLDVPPVLVENPAIPDKTLAESC